jgi:hypothetical protein
MKGAWRANVGMVATSKKVLGMSAGCSRLDMHGFTMCRCAQKMCTTMSPEQLLAIAHAHPLPIRLLGPFSRRPKSCPTLQSASGYSHAAIIACTASTRTSRIEFSDTHAVYELCNENVECSDCGDVRGSHETVLEWYRIRV